MFLHFIVQIKQLCIYLYLVTLVSDLLSRRYINSHVTLNRCRNDSFFVMYGAVNTYYNKILLEFNFIASCEKDNDVCGALLWLLTCAL